MSTYNEILQYGLILFTKKNLEYEYLLQNNLNGTYQDIRIDKNNIELNFERIITEFIKYLDLNILLNDIKYYTTHYIKSIKSLIIIVELPKSIEISMKIYNLLWVSQNKLKQIIKYNMCKNSSDYDLFNSINYIQNKKKYSKKIF
jgi:hypothetical protein